VVLFGGFLTISALAVYFIVAGIGHSEVCMKMI
jgi:hypothetical protein